MTNPYDNVEPTAQAREAARALRDQFLALVKEGFTEHQALIIIGQLLGMSRPQ